ncbi:4304_t:CDS:2 [Racocetra persica]|uniref:4304_t:CDS:1 n=1 Tax=Racocetra persica TaxID=160502 RepID=A0ACA9LWD5_9GLOM|nr:4304_t:CDS:2 [Racocetra persica]
MDDDKLAGNLSYHPVKNTEQPTFVSIKPQGLYDNNDNPLNLKELLKAIDLYDTFEKLNEVIPMLWYQLKNLESVEFQYLDLQIKLNEQTAIYEIGDFSLGILIPKFIIKRDVIEATNAIINLEYNGMQWSGNIQGMVEITGKDRKYNCQIKYMLSTKEQLGNLLIKNFNEDLNLKETLQIFRLESIFEIPVYGKLFEPMKISEININQVNSDLSDFIIQDLSFILQANKLELKPLIIEQVEVCISYFPPENNTDSATWKFRIEGNIDTMIATLNYNNEKRNIQATLVPVKSKKFKDITKLLIETPEFSDNSMYYEVYDSEITNVELDINIGVNSVYIESFSTKLVKVLPYDEFILDNLSFKYEEVKKMYIGNHSPNQVTPPHRKHILEAIISRKKATNDISAKIEIDCSENVVEASITSFSNPSILDILKFLIGYQSNLPDLLPKLPELPNFTDIKLDQKYSAKILIKPFKIIGFNISVEDKEINYKLLKKPSITLQPVGISINYAYDIDGKKEKLEGKVYGTFILDDMIELKLEFASSKTKDEDIVVASIESNVCKEGAIYISSIVNTLLDDNKGWSSKTPIEMRSPKFIVKSQNTLQLDTLSELILSTKEKAYLYINLSNKSVALYASIESIGNALLLVKKLNTKTSIDNEFGYIFALKTSNDFKTEYLFKSSNIVSNIDEILHLAQANLVIVSYQDVTFEKAKQELNAIIKDLNDILNSDNKNSKIKFEDIISINLPNRDDIYRQTLIQGANLYATLDYGKDQSVLLKNLCATTNLVSISQKILVELSLGTKLLSKSEFKAGIENLILYGGLNFEAISFSYKPKSSESELIISGDLNFKTLLGTEFNIKGMLVINEGSSSFKADSELLKLQSIENPFGMSGICIKGIEFDMNFDYKNDFVIIEPTNMSFNMAFNRKLQNSTHLKGKVGFYSGNQNIETIFEGQILFVNGTPNVCSIIIDKEIKITHLLAKILSVKWPTDFPDIIFNDGEIYYMPAYLPKDEIIIDKKVYNKGYNIRGHIDFFGIGEIKIKGSLLGIVNPTIMGCWSKGNKFSIIKWPSFCELIWKTAEFASLIEEASVGLCKEAISDLKLNENFEGHFEIDLKQIDTQSDNLVSFLITGKYLIRIIEGREKLTEIVEIDIPSSIQLDIKYPICNGDIPNCLLTCFKDQIPKSAAKFLQNLLKDPKKFAKFLDALAISTLVNLSEDTLKVFICFAGVEINKLAKDTLDAMKKCAKNILENTQPKNKPKENDILAIEEAQLLTSAIDLASSLLLITGEWFGYFSSAINLLKSLYEIIENNIIIIGKEQIERDKSKLSFVLKDDLLMRCKKVSVKIAAVLQYSDQTYLGSQSKEGIAEHKPKSIL